MRRRGRKIGMDRLPALLIGTAKDHQFERFGFLLVADDAFDGGLAIAAAQGRDELGVLAKRKVGQNAAHEDLRPKIERQDQLLQLLDEALVAGCPGDDLVEFDVEAKLPGPVHRLRGGVAPGLEQNLVQFGKILLGQAANRELHRQKDQGVHEIENLDGVVIGPGANGDAARMHALNHSDAFKAVKRVPHRGSADVQPVGDFALDQPLSLLDRSFSNGIQYTN